MNAFVRTETYLDKILAHKVDEVERARRQHPLAQVAQAANYQTDALPVIPALQRETVALIAEVKHASPSRGVLIDPFRPADLARTYADNGAAMLSVLTDEHFFKGSLDVLRQVRSAVDLPLLRKDFVFDEYQIYEARAAGADAVLLIVAALTDEQLHDLYDLAEHLGMTALVEVHSADELDRALQAEASLIGINNRDLRTFEVDTETTAELVAHIPGDVVVVAESGLKTAKDVQRMGAHGAQAVLVGEGLVTAPDIAQAVRSFSSQERRA